MVNARTSIPKNPSSAKSPKNLNSKVLPSSLIDQKYLKKLTNRANHPEKAWEIKFIFHPESQPRLSWDILILVSIIYQSLSIPYFICFDDPPSDLSDDLEFSINLIFMLDLITSFNTGFYSKGNLVMNRKEIIKEYVKFWFWLDLIATLPYNWLVGSVFNSEGSQSNAPRVIRLIRIFRFLKMLRLLRLAKLKKILVKLEDYIASNALANIFVFGKLLALVFFIAHWTACLWYYIGSQGIDSHPLTWVSYISLQDKEAFEKYITSLYWAFTTMSTVGYGDITPYTIEEKIYAMTTMIMASGVFAFTIGSIGALISKASAFENTYREQAVAVNRYMKRKKLTHNLQFRVRRYLDYIWENKKKNKLEEKQVLILLSEPLRDEIYSHIHGVVIKYCKIFDMYESNFISQLARTLISETFAPGDIIFEEGELSSKIYFIMNGKVRVFHAGTKTVYKELEDREYIGEIAFFSGNRRCASAQCIDFVDVLSLSRLNFNALSEKFPEAESVTSGIMKKCESEDYTDLNIVCYICTEKGHYSSKCRIFLINLDQEEAKKQWIAAKKVKNFKILKEKDVLKTLKSKRKADVFKRFEARNVIGVPREFAELDDRIFPLIPRTQDRDSSTGDSFDHLTRRRNLEELYVNTEENGSSSSKEVEESNIRNASFKLSLIKKNYIEDYDFDLRHSRRQSRTIDEKIVH